MWSWLKGEPFTLHMYNVNSTDYEATCNICENTFTAGVERHSRKAYYGNHQIVKHLYRSAFTLGDRVSCLIPDRG